MGRFAIDNPIDGKKQYIYYNSKNDKKELLQNVILNYWKDYCNEHWRWDSKEKRPKWCFEDKVIRFLDRCANFLLIGEYQKSDILSGKNIKRIIANEYSLEGEWDNDNVEVELEETIDYLNQYTKQQEISSGEILRDKYTNIPSKSKKKTKTKFTKIINIFSTDDKVIDIYKEIHISHNFSVWDKTKKTIKGRKGLINPNKPYIAEWCVVDTENAFEFQHNQYQIDKQIKQYDKRTKKPNYDDFKNDYQMDKILVYEQDNNKYFFDQNIDRIENKFIMEL